MDATNVLTEDDSASVCSTASDVSSVWGGAQDPTTVNLRALRKDINFKNKVFSEEHARVSKLSGDDLEVESIEPDQQRVGLAEAICKYVRVSMAAIMEGYGDQNARIAVIMSISKARNTYQTRGFLHPQTLFVDVHMPTDQEIMQYGMTEDQMMPPPAAPMPGKKRPIADLTIGTQQFDPRDAQRLRTSSPNKEVENVPLMEIQNAPTTIHDSAMAEDMLDPSSPNMPSYDTKVKSTESWVDRGGQPNALFKHENENQEVTKLAQQAAALAQQEKDSQELQKQIADESRILKEREENREKKKAEKKARLHQQKLQQQQDLQQRQQQQKEQAKREERERLIDEQAQRLARNEAQVDQMRQILKDLRVKNNDQNIKDLREEVEDMEGVEVEDNPLPFIPVTNKKKSPKKINAPEQHQQNSQERLSVQKTNNGPLRPTQQELDQVRAAEKRDQQRKEYIHQQRLQQQQYQQNQQQRQPQVVAEAFALLNQTQQQQCCL